MTPFLGSITIFGGNFAPVDWAFCNGQLLPISQFDALFALLGTTYGGDGITTFALPDLRGRVPIHFGNGFFLGQIGGTESVTLTSSQIPPHAHTVAASSSAANTNSPAGGVYASAANQQYAPPGTQQQAASNAVGSNTGNQSHNNMMPCLGLNFIIALQGIFPSQT